MKHIFKNLIATTGILLLLTIPSTDASAQLRKRLLREINELKEYISQLENELAELKGMPYNDPEPEGELEAEPVEYVEVSEPKAEAVAPKAIPVVVQKASATDESVFEQRLSSFSTAADLKYEGKIGDAIISFLDNETTPEILGLYEHHSTEMGEIFRKYDLPEELSCLAIIESGMDTKAVSWAGDKGIWQMPYATGKSYGLFIDSYVDERLNTGKSTDAMARYISDAHAHFGSWPLAICAYVCGAANVSRAVAKSGNPEDFWATYPYLPEDTRDCVTEYLAALYGVNFYREHGIEPSPVPAGDEVADIQISKKLHLRQVADVLGIPMEDLQALNPQYIHDIIPGNERIFTLRIPSAYSKEFDTKSSEIFAYKADELLSKEVRKQVVTSTSQAASDIFIGGSNTDSKSASAKPSEPQRVAYKVKSGDNLGKIAGKYHVTVAQIKKWNNLTSDMIRNGQTLYIYGKGTSSSAAGSGSSSSSASYTTYTVKPGDTLSGIAAKYHTTVDKIKRLNNMSSDNIRDGAKLKIPK